MVSEQAVKKVLKQVYDPELNFNIVDLGLIYGIEVKNEKDVLIKMTMTTPFCPYAPALLSDAKDQLGKISGIGQVEIEVVWDPPWETSKLAPEIRAKLGIL